MNGSGADMVVDVCNKIQDVNDSDRPFQTAVEYLKRLKTVSGQASAPDHALWPIQQLTLQ